MERTEIELSPSAGEVVKSSRPHYNALKQNFFSSFLFVALVLPHTKSLDRLFKPLATVAKSSQNTLEIVLELQTLTPFISEDVMHHVSLPFIG